MTPLRIRVPASTANIGPGFDSMGLALNLYLTVDVSPEEAAWRIEQHSPHLPELTHAGDHYIVKVARHVAARWNTSLPACHISVWSDIPLARGLGSSASAVVAGIELADQVCQLSLAREQKLELAIEMEGHPDNVAPAVMGGLVISSVTAQTFDWIRWPHLDVDVVVYIPDNGLETEAARNVLPDHYTRAYAVSASATSNVLVAALASGDYRLAGKMMEQDLFHEPYRQALLPHYDVIRRQASDFGAYGTVLSGAGPTMMSFAPKGKGHAMVSHFQKQVSTYDVTLLQVDNNGVVITTQ